MTAADSLNRREPRQLLAQPEAREMPAFSNLPFPRVERSHRFASARPIIGYERPTMVLRSSRYPSSALRRLFCRPNRWQFSCPTRPAADPLDRGAPRQLLTKSKAREPRKTQSA